MFYYFELLSRNVLVRFKNTSIIRLFEILKMFFPPKKVCKADPVWGSFEYNILYFIHFRKSFQEGYLKGRFPPRKLLGYFWLKYAYSPLRNIAFFPKNVLKKSINILKRLYEPLIKSYKQFNFSQKSEIRNFKSGIPLRNATQIYYRKGFSALQKDYFLLTKQWIKNQWFQVQKQKKIIKSKNALIAPRSL